MEFGLVRALRHLKGHRIVGSFVLWTFGIVALSGSLHGTIAEAIVGNENLAELDGTDCTMSPSDFRPVTDEMRVILSSIPPNIQFVDLDQLETAIKEHLESTDSVSDAILGEMTLGAIRWENGDYDVAMDTYDRAFSMARCVWPRQNADEFGLQIAYAFLRTADIVGGEEGSNYRRRGIAKVETLIADNPDASPDVFAYLASTFLSLETPDYESALYWFEGAINQALEQATKPKVTWYSSRVRLLILLERYQEALLALEQLMEIDDQQHHWQQLAFLYFELGMAGRQIGTMLPAIETGFFEEASQYVFLYQLLMFKEDAIGARKVIEKAKEIGAMSEQEYNRFDKQLLAFTDPGHEGGIDRGAFPLFRTRHNFPQFALEAGLSGCVIYGFSITDDGRTGDIHVISSSDSIFDPFGIRAIEQYRYLPGRIGSRPAEIAGQSIRLVWEVEHTSLPDHEACRGDEDFDPDSDPVKNPKEPDDPIFPKGFDLSVPS